MAVAQRLGRRLDDMLGGAEIGLADTQIDDVAPLGRQGGGPGQDGEGVLLADTIEIRDSFH